MNTMKENYNINKWFLNWFLSKSTGKEKKNKCRIKLFLLKCTIVSSRVFVSQLLSSASAPNAQGVPESEYVWTQSYSAAASTSKKASGVNVCGDEQVVEMKFSVPIDITAKHSSDTLKVTFGTKLGIISETNLVGASWGLSKVDLYLKSQQ